jgi:ligand-binding SRPBCC domain-containing protein
MDAPRAFVDEQRLGPFRFWHHRHTLAQIDGGVEMRDSVHYALPLGPFGRALHATLVRPRLERIFDFRRRTLDHLFNAPPVS